MIHWNVHLKKRMVYFLTCIAVLIGCQALIAVEAGDIQIWPRRDTVCVPTGLEQFIFMEFPSIKTADSMKIVITLPEKITVKSYPSGARFPVLPENTVVPTKKVQNGNVVILRIPKNKVVQYIPKNFWLVFSADVQTPPGMYQLKVEMFDGKKRLAFREFPVKVYPKLKSVKLKQLYAIAYAYNGLPGTYLPTFVNMLKSSGINELQLMHGDFMGTGTPGNEKENLVTYSTKTRLKLGFIFFVKKAIEYAKDHELLKGESVQWNLSWLIDNPKFFKKILKNYIDKGTSRGNYTTLVLDGETRAYRGRICGDTTPYGLKAFQKYAGITRKVKLTPKLIRLKFRKEWVAFRCHQTNRCVEFTRELIDEYYPNRKLMVFSGYEYNKPPYVDRTRKDCAVDWKSMADFGIDFGTPGYNGSMENIRATATALAGKAGCIPSESFLVNFRTKARFRQSPEEWSIRLINAFLNAGMKGGIAIWYGNDLEGSALISINRAADFMQKVESFALTGKHDNGAVKVAPASEAGNVYVLRKGGNNLLIAINPDSVAKKLRIRLDDFTLKGYVSDLKIIDFDSHKQIATKKTVTVNIAPYSYRLLNLIDGGN